MKNNIRKIIRGKMYDTVIVANMNPIEPIYDEEDGCLVHNEDGFFESQEEYDIWSRENKKMREKLFENRELM